VGKTRTRRRKVFDTPERRKNGRTKRRVLLDRSETGNDYRYGMAGMKVEYK
jgi:hypothetical protein